MTNGTGFDAIPVMFRRPIVQVNDVPVGYAYTWGNKPILLFKHHIDKKTRQELRLNEIFANNVAYALSTDDFAKHDIALIENSSEEIKAAVIEMDELYTYFKKNGIRSEYGLLLTEIACVCLHFTLDLGMKSVQEEFGKKLITIK